MFTGIVTDLATVHRMERQGDGARLTVRAPATTRQLARGDSVAVNGVCLTARETTSDAFIADLSSETLSRSTLGDLRAGQRVNLELAARVGDRLGGHLVQGHVDGVGTCREVQPVAGGGATLIVEAPSHIVRYAVEKGSVAVDGVSLTVAALLASGFSVALIPHTMAVTTLGLLGPGDRVNLEADLIAKYVERLLEGYGPARAETQGSEERFQQDLQRLREHGFL